MPDEKKIQVKIGLMDVITNALEPGESSQHPRSSDQDLASLAVKDEGEDITIESHGVQEFVALAVKKEEIEETEMESPSVSEDEDSARYESSGSSILSIY